MKLSINVDHVATLRQARRAAYPDPVEAARLAEGAGATGITVHLRGDRRHIQDADVERLRAAVRGKLNLEMAATAEMVKIALRLRPDQVTLVPERPEEVTTEGGLDLVRRQAPIQRAAEKLRAGGIAVSLFVDPHLRQLERVPQLGTELVTGFELNTDAYTRAAGEAAVTCAAEIAAAAAAGSAAGFGVYAGHGLTTANVGLVAAVREIEEANIGHSIIARAVAVGIATAVKEMLAAIAAARA